MKDRKLTLETPDDGHRGDDEKVESFQQETVPESQLSSEGDRIGKQSDVPLCRI